MELALRMKWPLTHVYITWALKQALENLLSHHPPVIVKKVKMPWLQQIAWCKGNSFSSVSDTRIHARLVLFFQRVVAKIPSELISYV